MKTLVLGFDGASPRLIDDWIAQLPTLRMFKEKGIYGHTIPPLPAQTPVAWSSFMTGMNPGNHGIFSFVTRMRGTYERQVIGPRTLKSETLWQILRNAGKKSGIVNVPMTDAEEAGGFVIPGFLSRQEGIPHPHTIRDKIKRRFGIDTVHGDLEPEVLEKVESDPDLFFESVNLITDEMADVCRFLLREEGWDIFMPVFMGLDRIQHFFWKYVDTAHPQYAVHELGNRVRAFYNKVDTIIGDFLKSVDEDTIVIVVSDHGFCPVHTEVIVNNYLEEQGLLKRNHEGIDVEASKAISYGYGDIWLNVKNREPKGIVNPGDDYEETRSEVIDCLDSISLDGTRPIKVVKRKEEVWWGPYLSDAPDLTAIFNVGYQAARRPLIREMNGSKRYVNENPMWSGGHDGTHDPSDVPGVIAMLGPGIPQGQKVIVHLWDIAPTILDMMHIPVPSDMDGKPIMF